VAEFIIGNPLRKLARKHDLLKQTLWRLDFALIWLIAKLSRLLPVDTASRFGSQVCTFIGPRLRHKTAIFHRNIAMAFPELSAAERHRLVIKAWGRNGRVLAEYVHLDTILQDPDRISIDIKGVARTYSDPTKPSVFVSAHQSNWEVACLAMARMNIPNASLYSPPQNPLLDKMLLYARQALNCELVPAENSSRLLMRAIKQGRSAAMIIDRRIDDGKPIEFFGYNKPSTILPARLALKLHCDLIPIQVERLKDAHFRVIFHPAIKPKNRDADEPSQAIDMIQQAHQQFEGWIRRRPEDWLCSKRIWPKTVKQ
jgi:KDO2-lipid IV(A) lauroyltransferase